MACTCNRTLSHGFYSVWDMYRARAVCTSEGGARGSTVYIQYEGGTYPMHYKHHETAVLYNRPRKATAQR